MTGAATRLTFGTGIESNPFPAGDKLVFSTLTKNIDLWAQPADTIKATVNGTMERLTQDPAVDYYPVLSFDGKTLAYMSTRSGNTDIWLRDMQTGRKTVAVAQVGFAQNPLFVRDGSKLFFGGTKIGGPWYSLPVAAAAISRPSDRKMLCDQCWPIWDITADDKWLLYDQKLTKLIGLRDLTSDRTVELIRTTNRTIGRARISPDNRWVAFNSSFKVFLVPLRVGVPVEQESWIPLAAEDQYYSGHPQWSPDSRTVYYYSDRDGHYCIWAQRIDPVSGGRDGDAFPVVHLHDVRRSLSGISTSQMGMTVARERIILNLSEMTGNVWMTQPERK